MSDLANHGSGRATRGIAFLQVYTGDFASEAIAQLAARLNRAARDPFVLRDCRPFLDGLELVEPGVVQVDPCDPDRGAPLPNPSGWPSFYDAVGTKP